MEKKKVELPILVLLEQMRWQRTIIGALDTLTPRLAYEPDRDRMFQIREELLAIFVRDLNLKKGVSPLLLDRAYDKHGH